MLLPQGVLATRSRVALAKDKRRPSLLPPKQPTTLAPLQEPLSIAATTKNPLAPPLGAKTPQTLASPLSVPPPPDKKTPLGKQHGHSVVLPSSLVASVVDRSPFQVKARTGEAKRISGRRQLPRGSSSLVGLSPLLFAARSPAL